MTLHDAQLEDSWRDALARVAPRHDPFPLDGPWGRVWVKPVRYRSSRLWHLLHRLAARLLGISLFNPPAYKTGPDQIADEARRLAALARRGLPVPAIYAQDRDYLVLADNGRSVRDLLLERDHSGRLALLADALEFVLDLHASGGWHGGCQVRNITWRDDGFGLIDFDDDIEGSAPLPARQARDIVQFMMSAVRHLDHDHVPSIAELLRRAAEGSTKESAAELEALGRRLRLLRPAARRIGARLGRDGRDLAVLILALNEVFPHRRR